MPRPPTHRLRKHADYQDAYSRSRRQSTRQFSFFVSLRPATRRSETPGPRIGLTVPKAIGKAHDRNRIKRRVRAAIRANLALLTTPADLILHPRRSVLTADFADLSRELAGILRSSEKLVSRLASTPLAAQQAPQDAALGITLSAAPTPSPAS